MGSYSLPACSPTTQDGPIYQPMPIQESREQQHLIEVFEGGEMPVVIAAPALIQESIDGQGNVDVPGYRSPIPKQNVFRDGRHFAF